MNKCQDMVFEGLIAKNLKKIANANYCNVPVCKNLYLAVFVKHLPGTLDISGGLVNLELTQELGNGRCSYRLQFTPIQIFKILI